MKLAHRSSWTWILTGTIGLAIASTLATAGTVKSVNSKKKTVTVTLDEEEVVEKDAELCFFTASDKKIDCGVVARTKGKLALVKMKSAKRLKRIKAGTVARATEEVDAQGEPVATKVVAPAGKVPFRVWGTFSPAFATPSVYNKLGYLAPDTATPETLWVADSKVSNAILGLNLQAGIPVGAKALNVGLRYRAFTPSLIDADYIAQTENPFVRTEQQATAFGLWVDYQFLRIPMLTASSFGVSSGLDIDQSTVKFKATKKDDTGATPEVEVAKADSSLTLISLRLTTGFDLVFAKPLGGHIGLTLMVPVAEATSSFKGSIANDEARGLAEPGDDLKKQLGHKKNSVAAELSLGGMLSF